MQILSDVINDLSGGARPVEIKLFGEELGSLEGYAQSLAPKMSKIDGLEDFFNGVSEPSAEMLLRVNEAEANRIGLDPTTVDDQLTGAMLGASAGQVRREDRAINVRVRAPDSVRFSPTQLGALPIVNLRTREATPLSALATVTPSESRAELLRENHTR